MKWAKRTTSARDKASVPAGVVPPMHPTLVDKVPEGPNWLHEIKWDGYRIGVYLLAGKIRILTRNLHDWTNRFPSIVEAVSGIDAKSAMIDGEAFVADPQGMPHFNLLQRGLGNGGNQNAIMFAAFDLPLMNSADLRDQPLTERRDRLRELLGSPPPAGIIFSEEFEGVPGDLLKQACAFGLRVGGVGTGFNARSAPALKTRLDELTTGKPAIAGLRNKPRLDRRWATASPLIPAGPRRQVGQRIPLGNHYAGAWVPLAS
jgi:ATP-dependent DNA ligase